MARIVVAHRGEGVGEAPLQGWVEIGPRREHAVIVGVGRPDLDQGTFGHQALVAQSLPERTAYRAGIGATVEDRANDLRLARARVAMLADIAVEAKRAVVAPPQPAVAPGGAVVLAYDDAAYRAHGGRADVIVGATDCRQGSQKHAGHCQYMRHGEPRI